MRFELVKKGRKDNKVQKLLDQFLASKFEKVEVFNEGDYESNAQMTASIRFAIKSYYDGQLRISRTNDRIFLSKLNNK
jgi:hypothetical protein